MVAPSTLTHEQRPAHFDRAWVPRIRRRLYRRGLIDPYAQDAIIQSVRLRIWRYRPDCGDPKIISKATSHSLIDYVRQQKSRTRLEATQSRDAEHMQQTLDNVAMKHHGQPMTQLEQADLREAIESQLSMLSPESATLIRRHYFAGESLAQIGMSLGVAEGTVSKWLKTIRGELAQSTALKLFVM